MKITTLGPWMMTGATLTAAALLASVAYANPIASEIEPGFTAAGSAVEAHFLGVQSTESYNMSLRVQWQFEGAWVTAEGTWNAGDTVKADNGSGLMDLVMFQMTVACLATGEQGIRLAFYNSYHDDYGEWFNDKVTCEAATQETGGVATGGETSGGTEGGGSSDGACTCASGGRGAPLLAIFVALFHRRRRRTAAAS